MKIIAHRGASVEAPENTLSAFKRAIELGSDYIECDIRLTKDKVPIVFHDDKINETLISELTFEEVKSQNENIPTLEELLSLKFNKTGLMIEIKKIDPLSDVEIIYDTVNKKKSPPDFYLGSIEIDIAIYLHQLDPELPLIGIVELEEHLDEFLKLNPQVLAFHYSLLDPKRIASLQAKKIKVWAWTIDDPHFEMEGLDGIITNNVAHFLQTRSPESGAH
jgi:glycerophosphoryl diester phosphodiesterase